MLRNILIIGFGNIGYRHYQSLSANNIFKTYVVDKKKYRSNKFAEKINQSIYFNNIIDLKIKEIEILIISTDVKSRIKNLRECIKKFSIKNVILEKIVFNNISEYRFALGLVKNKRISNIFLNYPRETIKFYKNLKVEIQTPIKSIIVKGNRWNMGSNFMHFIYLFKYLTSANKIKILDVNTHKKIYKSKRLGYHEIKGSILLQNEKKQELLIMDRNNLNFQIEIITKDRRYIINESQNKIFFTHNKKTKILKETILLKQSQLTSGICNDILRNKANLPNLQSHYWVERVFFNILKIISHKSHNKKIYLT